VIDKETGADRCHTRTADRAQIRAENDEIIQQLLKTPNANKAPA
jgi:hypothetical protein